MSEYADPADPRDSAERARSVEPARRNRGKVLRLPKRPAKIDKSNCNLSLDSAATSVPIAIVKESPTLLVAAVEDLCWRFSVQEWSGREPARSDHEAHDAWQSEIERFNDKRVRIREMVDEALMAS